MRGHENSLSVSNHCRSNLGRQFLEFYKYNEQAKHWHFG
jgi:hypothetical protein